MDTHPRVGLTSRTARDPQDPKPRVESGSGWLEKPQAGSDQCWASHTTHISARPTCLWGFFWLGGPCQALHNLCSQQGCCQGCTRKGCSGPIASRACAPAESPAVPGVHGILGRKGFSPPRPHTGHHKLLSWEISAGPRDQAHMGAAGIGRTAATTLTGHTFSLRMPMKWAERSLPSLSNGSVIPRLLIPEPDTSVGQGKQPHGQVAAGSQWCGRRWALRGGGGSSQHCVPAHDGSLALPGERSHIGQPCQHSWAAPGSLAACAQPVPSLLRTLRGHLCVATSSAGTARPATPSNRVGSDPSFGLSHGRSWGPLVPGLGKPRESQEGRGALCEGLGEA